MFSGDIEVHLWLEMSELVPINIWQLKVLEPSTKSIYFQHVFYESNRIH